MKNRIFLGGTCNNSTWREDLIPQLKVDYFNPVVEDWTEECQAIEEDEKKNKCDIHLYVITKEMTGVFSIAEIIDSCYHVFKDTVVQIKPEGFDEFQLKSLKAVLNLAKERGATTFMSNNLEKLVKYLNYHAILDYD